ncbi:HAD family hydrolase [Deinococcus lacus]|uniref:HAD family hydrolase n=1 Tax=Deinococcus lacus TaxID=392561 RepID=A0ABW1YFD4_9DEIO
MSNLRAIVFDFDGTIFDTESREFWHWQQLYRDHGRELQLSDWQSGIGTWGAFDPWLGLPPEVQENRSQVQADLHSRLMADLSEQDLRPGVRDLLGEIGRSGLRLGLATSSGREWVTRWLSAHGLQGTFEVMTTQDDVRRVKPDPELYALAVERLGLHPAECLAVEDSLNGATAAVAAGLRVAVVPNEVTATQPFLPLWPRLEGFGGGLAALKAAYASWEENERRPG